MDQEKELNGYTLSRDWFDFCFENPELIRPIHTALYFFIIEHCNRLGWKAKFGLPMEMTKDAIGVKNYKTYSKGFNDLVDWGFIKVIERSKNQYSSNIIALVQNTKTNGKALSKAMLKHSQKQVHGIVGIDKPITIKPITINYMPTYGDFEKYALEVEGRLDYEIDLDQLKLKYESWKENNWHTGGKNSRAIKNWKTTLLNTFKYIKKEKDSAQKENTTASKVWRDKLMNHGNS